MATEANKAGRPRALFRCKRCGGEGFELRYNSGHESPTAACRECTGSGYNRLGRALIVLQRLFFF